MRFHTPGDSVQVTAGTHGIFSDATATTLIGKLDAGMSETWHWKAGAAFPTQTFYLKFAAVPGNTRRAPEVWDYPDQTLGPAATVTPGVGTRYRVKRANGTEMGWLVKEANGNLGWHIAPAHVADNRLAVVANEVLTFEYTTAAPNSGSYCSCTLARRPDLV